MENFSDGLKTTLKVWKKLYNWRASEASKKLSGVYRFEICDMDVCTYMYVCKA